MEPEVAALSCPRGKITVIDPVTGDPVLMVWQKTWPPLANASKPNCPALQFRSEPGGLKGMSPGQVAARSALAQAVEAWSNLSDAEKEYWKQVGKSRRPRLPAYQTFISNFIQQSASGGA